MDIYQYYSQPQELLGWDQRERLPNNILIRALEGKPISNRDLKSMAQDPETAYSYAYYVLKDRWPQGEPAIAKNPILARHYARSLIRGPWPEAEPTILQSPDDAYIYANLTLKRPWPEAEPIILKDPMTAAFYAADVLGKRWKEAEPIIQKNPEAWKKYRYWLRTQFNAKELQDL